jgi:hypothetical protein
MSLRGQEIVSSFQKETRLTKAPQGCPRYRWGRLCRSRSVTEIAGNG